MVFALICGLIAGFLIGVAWTCEVGCPTHGKSYKSLKNYNEKSL